MFWLLLDCLIDLFLFTNEICELKEAEGGVQTQTDLFYLQVWRAEGVHKCRSQVGSAQEPDLF